VSRSGRRARTLAVAALVLGALAPPTAVSAQSLEGRAGGYVLLHRLLYHNVVYDQTGTVYGGDAAFRLGPLLLGASGWTGSLVADGAPPNGGVRVRTTAATLRVAVLPELLVGVQVEARRFASEAGVTVWRMKGWDVLFQPELGITGLRGVAEVAVLSSSAVREGPRMDVALQTTMGATYDARHLPLRLRLAYRFERYDMQSVGATDARLEQFRGLVAEVGLRPALFRGGRSHR
jgi:hypothetical protein